MQKWFCYMAGLTFCLFIFIWINLQSIIIEKLDEWGVTMFEGKEILILFHYIAETPVVIVITLLLIALLWWRARNYRAISFVLLTVAGGTIVNQILKKIIQRDRPLIADQLTSYSFPSGHSMMSVLYLLTIAYFIVAYSKSKAVGIISYVIAASLAILVGLSRVAESRHFMSDVIAGWSLGFTVFMLVVCWYTKKAKIKRSGI